MSGRKFRNDEEGDGFPVSELRGRFGGGGSFRSGVQPPTGMFRPARP